MLSSIGIDNGVTGSIGIIRMDDAYSIESQIVKTPIKTELNYTKTKKYINRIDVNKLIEILEVETKVYNCNILLERPMVNPRRYAATCSALRSLEATLCVIEQLNIPYRYIDSKEWQRKLLPNGIKTNELKNASIEIGKRLYPEITKEAVENKFKDVDGLLIAHYLHLSRTGGL